MTNKTILQTGGHYEVPTCELLEVSLDTALFTDSLGTTIGEYSEDGTVINFD